MPLVSNTPGQWSQLCVNPLLGHGVWVCVCYQSRKVQDRFTSDVSSLGNFKELRLVFQGLYIPYKYQVLITHLIGKYVWIPKMISKKEPLIFVDVCQQNCFGLYIAP